MIGQYRPGTGPLHRARAGAKLLGVFLIALIASLPLPVPLPWRLGALAVIVAALYLVAGLGLRELARQVLSVRWVLVILLVSQMIFADPAQAYLNTARLTIILLAAALLTLTTRTQDLLDVLVWLAGPLRYVGVDPERIGLAFSLTIRTIPQLAERAGALRDAQHARGQRVRVVALVLPLLVLAMRHSDDVADALVARGAGDR